MKGVSPRILVICIVLDNIVYVDILDLRRIPHRIKQASFFLRLPNMLCHFKTEMVHQTGRS